MKNTVFYKNEPMKWYLLDASGKILGRFAAEISKILRGKHKTTFTPNMDLGDGVIIINAEKVKLTGQKEARKIYRKYSGFISGMKEISCRDLRKKDPSEIIYRAVSGMMPKTKLGKKQIKRLQIFIKDTHNVNAQQPIKLEI